MTSINLEEQLRDYFKDKGGSVINKEGVKIGLCEGDHFYLQYTLEEDKKEGLQFELYDEVKGMQPFIEAFSLQNLSDLQIIKRSDLWIRWLAEKAEVIFTNGDGNNVHFRLFRGKTMIFSYDLHYYDEEMHIMNITDHFKKYIEENWSELEEMSYKRG